jgi:predicted MFS family arabinose efflux permease
VAPKHRRPVVALLVAEIISTTGGEITAVALPWFVLVTTGSPARMGAVLAAGFLGMAVLGIPSGRAATSLGPRRTMLVADAACAPAIALIPALHWAGLLSFPVIVVVAFVVGAFFPAYTSSQSLVLAALVDEDERRLLRTGAQLGSVNETASFVGPALGGLLVAFLGAAPVLLIDAASYLAAFALVSSFVPPVTGERPEPSERSVRAGMRYLRGNQRLLRTVAGLAVIELAFTALIATLPVLTRRRYHSTARLAGWLLASYGAGSVAGGLLTTRARSLDGRIGALALGGLAVTTWPLLLTLPSYGVALVIAANGGCSGLYFSRFFTSVTLRTPPALRARVSAAVNTLISSTGPVGFVAAGLLLQHASLRATYALVAAAATVGAAIALAAMRSQGPA